VNVPKRPRAGVAPGGTATPVLGFADVNPAAWGLQTWRASESTDGGEQKGRCRGQGNSLCGVS